MGELARRVCFVTRRGGLARARRSDRAAVESRGFGRSFDATRSVPTEVEHYRVVVVRAADLHAGLAARVRQRILGDYVARVEAVRLVADMGRLLSVGNVFARSRDEGDPMEQHCDKPRLAVDVRSAQPSQLPSNRGVGLLGDAGIAFRRKGR